MGIRKSVMLGGSCTPAMQRWQMRPYGNKNELATGNRVLKKEEFRCEDPNCSEAGGKFQACVARG
jgi:hypothetical protein